MPRTTVTATIPAGQSLSNAVDMSVGMGVFLHLPTEWTPAILSFQISPDNILWGDLVAASTHEMTMNVTPGTVVKVDVLPATSGWTKFRSGSRYRPVPQAADRVFTITIET